MLTKILRLFRPFFISTKLHNEKVSQLAADSLGKNEQIEALELQIRKLKYNTRVISEDLRYFLGEVANSVREEDAERGTQIHSVGHVMPYLLAPYMKKCNPGYTRQILAYTKKEMAEKYEFSLPDEPEKAVKPLLWLAIALIDPRRTQIFDTLREEYPLRNNVEAETV